MSSYIAEVLKGRITPLKVIGIFLLLVEAVVVFGIRGTLGGVQVALTVFAVGFPVLVLIAFFLILWKKNYVLYTPDEFNKVSVGDFVGGMSGKINSIHEKKLHDFVPEIIEDKDVEDVYQEPSDTYIECIDDTSYGKKALLVNIEWSVPEISSQNTEGHIIFKLQNLTGKTILILGYRMFRISPTNTRDVFYNSKICEAEEFNKWLTSPAFKLVLMNQDEHVYHWGNVNIPETYGINEPGKWATEVQIAYLEEESKKLLTSSAITHLEFTNSVEFSKIQGLMPELLEEMKDDLKKDETRLIREFFILPNRNVGLGGSEKDRFVYYENEHKGLRNKIDFLGQYDFVYDVTTTNTPIYRMSEEFVNLLIEKDFTN